MRLSVRELPVIAAVWLKLRSVQDSYLTVLPHGAKTVKVKHTTFAVKHVLYERASIGKIAETSSQNIERPKRVALQVLTDSLKKPRTTLQSHRIKLTFVHLFPF